MDIQVGEKTNHVSVVPDCFARVIRFTHRNTLESNILHQTTLGEIKGIVHDKQVDALATETIDIHSDILSCSISKSKGNPEGSFELSLAPGRINYMSTIHPGDHILIYMKRNANPNAPLNITNDINSGLKLYGVVTGVRRVSTVSPSGQRSIRFTVSGTDFGYFYNAQIYFDPILGELLASDNVNSRLVLYSNLLGQFTRNYYTPGVILAGLLEAFTGTTLNKNVTPIKNTPISPNDLLRVPSAVANIFQDTNKPKSNISDIVKQQIGITQYQSSKYEPDTSMALQGFRFFQIEPGTAYTIWSILSSYLNSTLNEMYLDLKPHDDGKLHPTIVARQLPFTSTAVAKKINQTTDFLTLPRMKLPLSFILSEDSGKSGAYCFNYIQLKGHGAEVVNPFAAPFQTLQGNFAIDKASISRYGTRTMIVDTNNDFSAGAIEGKTPVPTETKDGFKISMVGEWIKLYADWYLDAHLWITAHFETIGIEEPLSLGDNLEITREDGTTELYHIESYSHNYSVDSSGYKSFRTSLQTSRGRTISSERPYQQLNDTTDQIHDSIGLTNTGNPTYKPTKVSK